MKKVFLAVLLFMAIAPLFAFAAHNAPNTFVWSPSILKGPLTVCTGNYVLDQSANPPLPKCQDLCDFFAQIIQILYFIMGIGLWVVVPIMFAHAGILVMLSRGNPAKASEGRKAATAAVIGVAVMVCAWLIVSTFVGFFKLANIGGFSGSGNCIIAPTTSAGASGTN